MLCDALAALTGPTPLTAETIAQLNAAMESYLQWATEEFAVSHDSFRLIGEDNYRRYLPVSPLRVRIHADDTPFEIFARAAAAVAAGCRSVISIPPEIAGPAPDAVTILDRLTDPWAASIEFLEESDDELAGVMNSGATRRVRYAHHARVPEAIRRASAESYVYIADAPVLAEGRVELLWYLQEQSLSHIYHRYGNLGRRSEEERAAVL
jgi:RHH-type proline utilization regulon transcriptional repressor/proline dehydrogenase/delta 1-pyrroline-5-carboxylate dehydrogenase